MVETERVYCMIPKTLNWLYNATTSSFLPGRKVPYGFGFRIDTKDKNSIYHYGKWNGFSTGLTTYLEDDLVVIILEHTSYNALKSLNRKIKNIITKNFNI